MTRVAWLKHHYQHRTRCEAVLIAGAVMAYCGLPRRHRGPCQEGKRRDALCRMKRTQP